MTLVAPAPVWLRPALFDSLPGIVAGFSTRHGGVSATPFASLNLGLSTNDDREAVLENRRLLFETVGFEAGELAITGQVHGSEVAVVQTPGLYPGFDGLVTTTPRLMLCISAADCASVLIATAEGGMVGACHAGWRGAAGGIIARTVGCMTDLGAESGSLRAYISPCISAARFEVGPEVAVRFDARFVVRASGEKPHVDLKGALVAQLVEAGLEPDFIEVSPHCTHTDTTTFYSHRAEGGVTGRMMGFIGICA
jgi:polyphenol oxidase